MKSADLVDAMIAYMRSAESTIEQSTASPGQRRAALVKAFDAYVDERIESYMKRQPRTVKS